MLKLNKIYCGDTFELLKNIENNTIDLIICDGPYGVTTKDWDKVINIQELNLTLIRLFSEKLKNGGVAYLFGKYNCIDFIDYRPFLYLQTKIVWYQPSRLAQGRLKYTNNYDIICYFTKGKKPTLFSLDAIRVPQLVELQHRLRCEKVPSVRNGAYKKTKFNSKGKNPGDVWGDIKQLTYHSKELLNRKMLNTIQKPEKLMERLIKASSKPGDVILDPFAGTGTSCVVAKRLQRTCIGFEKDRELAALANKRIETA